MKQMKVACYAAGIIGSSFAVNFAIKDIKCSVYVTNEDRKTRCVASIQHVIDSLKSYGVLDDAEATRITSNINITTDPAEAFTDVVLIQENGPEKLEIKQEIMQIVDKYAPADAIFASSTSSISITKIAQGSVHPERCIGAHPFNPPHLIPLVEITKSENTQDVFVQKAKEIYTVAGKVPVVLNKEKIGFIANRFSHVVLREMIALVTGGVCSMEDADRALVYGPGLRWGAIGQGLVGELGCRNGFRESAVKFKPVNEAIFRDIENLTVVPDDWADLAGSGVDEEKRNLPDFIGHTNEDIAKFRDEVLIALLKIHRKL